MTTRSVRAGRFIARVVFLAAMVALLAAGCGRTGFDETGVFSAAPVSDANALVGCSIDIRSDGPDGYAVMWHEYPPTGGDRHAIVFARFDTAGTITVGPEVVDTTDSSIEKIWLHLGENGGYQAFVRRAASNTTRSLRIDRDGGLVTLEDLFSHSDEAFLVRDDSGFSLFFEEGEHLHRGRISPRGELSSEPADFFFPEAKDEGGSHTLYNPRGIRTETGIHMVFEHSWRDKIAYARFDTAGNYIAGRVEDFGSHQSPAIASDGMGNLMLAWYDDGQLTEYALDESGEPLWTGVRQEIEMNREESPSMTMAGGGGRVAMVWESDADTILPQIMFRSLEADINATGKSEPLGTPGFAHSCPAIARGEGHFGVAYRGELDGEHKLFVGIRHD